MSGNVIVKIREYQGIFNHGRLKRVTYCNEVNDIWVQYATDGRDIAQKRNVKDDILPENECRSIELTGLVDLCQHPRFAAMLSLGEFEEQRRIIGLTLGVADKPFQQILSQAFPQPRGTLALLMEHDDKLIPEQNALYEAIREILPAYVPSDYLPVFAASEKEPEELGAAIDMSKQAEGWGEWS